jgi:hypothetical protein
MRTSPAQAITHLTMVTRGLWPDRNPLRRSSDRAEAGMLAVLIIALVAGVPLIALIAWRLTLSATSTTVQARHAGWRQVPAVLLVDAPRLGYFDLPVPATWTAPDGARRTGMVNPSPGAQAGTTTPIWVNAAGRQVAWPATPRQAAAQADLIAAIAGSLWAMMLLAAGIFGHSLIDAHRMAGWDAALRSAHMSGPASTNP